jgi:NTP pyrophosphatase (non-canonical NTP hydrolase)
MTKAGDEGFRISIGLDDDGVYRKIQDRFSEILTAVDRLTQNCNDAVSRSDDVIRIQSEDDLEELGLKYKNTLAIIQMAESMGFQLNQLHLGSCCISADASIRGVLNGVDVSYENDLLDDGLGVSLYDSAFDLMLAASGYVPNHDGTTATVPYSFGTDIHPGFAKIVEEGGELFEVIGKIMMIDGRFNHWVGDLRKALHDELADVSAAVDFYVAQPVNFSPVERAAFFERKMTKLAKFEDWDENPRPLPE